MKSLMAKGNAIDSAELIDLGYRQARRPSAHARWTDPQILMGE